MTRNRLLVRLGTALLAAALLFSVAAAAPRTAAAQITGLVLAFEGTVERGPSTGTVLTGDLNLAVAPDGRFDGGLVTAASEVPVEGRLVAGNLSITFILGEGSYIFGIGQARADGSVRGSFIGPQEGDGGRWLARPIQNVELAFSGTVERGPSRGTTLIGPLLLKITGERFTGLLKIADGTSVPVVGRLRSDDGQTQIRITFDLGNGVTIVGTGVQGADGGFAGRFRGPAEGDRGSWTATPTQ
jgi:hypothetical protein